MIQPSHEGGPEDPSQSEMSLKSMAILDEPSSVPGRKDRMACISLSGR